MIPSDNRRWAKVAGSTLGASEKGDQALVVTNLSLLDTFTEMTGEEWGWVLAKNLEEAIRTNPGPAVIVDSFAPLDGTLRSAPRAWLVAQLTKNEEGVSWIQYDEGSADPYGDMLEELIHALTILNVSRVVLGGIWYGTDEEGGCVDPVIDTIALYYPVEVKDTLIGCGV